jgi:hypothetical protein
LQFYTEGGILHISAGVILERVTVLKFFCGISLLRYLVDSNRKEKHKKIN